MLEMRVHSTMYDKASSISRRMIVRLIDLVFNAVILAVRHSMVTICSDDFNLFIAYLGSRAGKVTTPRFPTRISLIGSSVCKMFEGREILLDMKKNKVAELLGIKLEAFFHVKLLHLERLKNPVCLSNKWN